MKVTKEYYICDRCHEEHDEKELWSVSDWMCFYQLCDNCKQAFKEYEEKRKEIEKQMEDLSKEYKFGRHLPRRDENE